jgi:hypothetical protein
MQLTSQRLTGELLRWSIYSVTLLHIFSVGGVIFGWSGLFLILSYSGVYAEDCPADIPSCPTRELKLSFLFVIGVLGSKLAILIFAPWHDRLGPKTLSCFGNLLFLIGSVTLAVAESTWPINLFPGAVLVMSMGSGLSYFPLMHNAMLFKHVSISTSGLATAREFSSMVYPILFIIYYYLIRSRFVVFMLYNLYCVVIFGLGWTLFRYKRFKRGEAAVWEPIPTSCFHHDSTAKGKITEDLEMEGAVNGVDQGITATTEGDTNMTEPQQAEIVVAESGKEAIDTDIVLSEQEAENARDGEEDEEGMQGECEEHGDESDCISEERVPVVHNKCQEWWENKKKEIAVHLSPTWLIPLTYFAILVYIAYAIIANLPAIVYPMYSLTGISISDFLTISSFVGPLGAVFGPLAGVMKQFLGNGTSFFALSLLTVISSVLLLIPILEVQFLSLFIFGVMRVALNSIGLAYIIDDQPEQCYGSLLTDLTVTTIFSLLAVYPTNFVSYELLNGNMIPLLILILILGILGFGVAIYFWVHQAAIGKVGDKQDDPKDEEKPEDQEKPDMNDNAKGSQGDSAVSDWSGAE